eukprot:gene4390-4976_t
MKKITLALFVATMLASICVEVLHAENSPEDDEADLEDFEKAMLEMENKDEGQTNEELDEKDPRRGVGKAIRLLIRLWRRVRRVNRVRRVRLRRVSPPAPPPPCAERRRRSWDPSRRRGCPAKKR